MSGPAWYTEGARIYDGADFCIAEIADREADEETGEPGYKGADVARQISTAVNAFDLLLAVAKAVTHLRVECQPGEYHYCAKCDQQKLDVQHATWCPIAALDATAPGWRKWTP